MRRAFTLTAVALLVGGLLYWLMATENGFILIAVGNQVVQLSLWMAILTTLILIVLWRMLERLYRGLIKSGTGWRPRRQTGPIRYRARTARGLTEFFEGRWARARRTLEKSARHSDIPHINYLAAASAAVELRDWPAVRALLAKACETSGSDIPSLLIEGKMLVAQGQANAALVCFRKILEEQPGHPLALCLLAQVYRDLSDWQNLERLLPALRTAKVYVGDDRHALEAKAYAGLLRGLGARADEPAELREQIEDLWKKVPKPVRNQPEVVAARVELLDKSGQSDRAEKEIRRCLNQGWNGELVLLYGQLRGADRGQQLIVAEAWNRQWPNDAEVLLTLGRLSARNQLWGKAREHLEQSLRLSPRLATYVELAALMAEIGEPEKSHNYYRVGVEQYLSNASGGIASH